MKSGSGLAARVMVGVMVLELWGMGWGCLGAAEAAKAGEPSAPGQLAGQPWLTHADEALGEAFNGTLALSGAVSTNDGAEFRLNLHLQAPAMDNAIDLIAVEIRYDRRLFEYVRATRLAEPGISEPGRLRLLVSGGRFFRAAGPGEYGVSRISELYFRAKAPSGAGDFTLMGADFYVSGQRLAKEHLRTGDGHVTIKPKPPSDLSGDGLVSLGDLALSRTLPHAEQETVAALSRNAPYKRVVLIGLDGAGIAVTPQAPFFASLSAPVAQVGDRYKLPNLRRILASGAVTYSAHSTLPSYSSPNWGAMLTGVDYSKHRINNRISGKFYYPEDSRYPTVFSRLRQTYPGRKLASFAHWKNIGNGHIEPSAGVSLHTGNDESLIRQFKGYVEEGHAKDSSFIFLVLNGVDNAGHAHGWYTRKYYRALEKADARVGEVESILRDAGLLEDTLVLLVSDHGGGTLTADKRLSRAKHHGQKGELATTTFIAAAGRTVAGGSHAVGALENGKSGGAKGGGMKDGKADGADDGMKDSKSGGAGGDDAGGSSERLLTGGHTRDVAAMILYGLGLPPDIGDARLLPGMFADGSASALAHGAELGQRSIEKADRVIPAAASAVVSLRPKTNSAAVAAKPAITPKPATAIGVYTLATGKLPPQTVAMEVTVAGTAADQVQVTPLQSGLQVFTEPVAVDRIRLLLTHKDRIRADEPLAEISVVPTPLGLQITQAWTADANGNETMASAER